MSTYTTVELQAEDFCFDFQKHKKLLTDLFFPKKRDFILSRDSQDYENFWQFLQRMQAYLSSKMRPEGQLNKTRFDPRCRLNLSTVNMPLEDYIRHNCSSGPSRTGLSAANLRCAHLIFDMYLDFLEKQKLQRVMKIKQSRKELPIAQHRQEIVDAVRKYQVVLVAGDTGCGKSTQVPQYLNEAGYKKVAVTQPRRIACLSLAARVKTETMSERRSLVGYQVRFEKSSNAATQILFLTEGLLLRQMQTDPMLKNYSVIVLDEVHERHWQTDCLLGLMKCLTYARPEVRIVLMSATINTELFSQFFDDCPCITVPGRLHPIELRYLPLTPSEQESERIDPAPYLRLFQLIDKKYPARERGDLLVFLSGMNDIQTLLGALRAYAESTKRWIVLPLHSALSVQEQDKIFHHPPEGVRKCILSTNIAETSVTIDGIRFVADSGKMKEISWDNSARMRRLKEFKISRASADQRKGRAGRTGPGVCFRLFTEQDYQEFQAFNTPEIRRVPLDTLVLQMMAMGLPDVRKFPFVELPHEKGLDDAIDMLLDHGAVRRVDTDGLAITALGRLLADLPVDLSIGRMLVMASLFGVVDKTLTLAAALSVQSPISLKASGSGTSNSRMKFQQRMEQYESDHGTPFTIATLFDEWIQLKSAFVGGSGRVRALTRSLEEEEADSGHRDGGSITDPRKWCQRLNLEEQRFHEMVRIRAQFAQLLRDCGLLRDTQRGATSETASPPSANAKKADEHDRRRRKLQMINSTKRREQMQSKRRRILTLEDGAEEGGGNSESSDEEANDCSESALHRFRKWTRKEGQKPTEQSADPSAKDLELLLCFNLNSLASYADEQRRSLTKADMLLLKVVLCGGLYPHVAIADAANAYRVAHKGGVSGPGAEMVFHTPTKNFVMLQPNDIFVRKPDILFTKEKHDDVPTTSEAQRMVEKPHVSQSKAAANKDSPFATDHQQLVYLDLMETTKPFIVNSIRVPLLPVLLLYARRIDTNWDGTRVVFDKWIQVTMLDDVSAQRALACTVWLRTSLARLMREKLRQSIRHATEADSGLDASCEEESREQKEPRRRDPVDQQTTSLQRLLAHSLAVFLSRSPGGLYSFTKLHAVDVKKLYRIMPTMRPEAGALVGVNRQTGGYQVTDFLTVNCLFKPMGKKPMIIEGDLDEVTPVENTEEQEDPMQDLSALDLAQRLKQQANNARMAGMQQQEEAEEDGTAVKESSVSFFKCENCGAALSDNSKATVLRHRKTCASAPT